jgi:hypothetical protein
MSKKDHKPRFWILDINIDCQLKTENQLRILKQRIQQHANFFLGKILGHSESLEDYDDWNPSYAIVNFVSIPFTKERKKRMREAEELRTAIETKNREMELEEKRRIEKKD